jgi:hypothetical protein
VEPIPVAMALVAEIECDPDTGTDKAQCYDVHEEFDPYPDPDTCKPHSWQVVTKKGRRPAANPANTR